MRLKPIFRGISVILGLLIVAFIVWNSLPRRIQVPVPAIATTRILEPLRADGWVDYLAAANQKRSRGVTSENNGAVLFLQAVGPRGISEAARPMMYQLLGLHPSMTGGRHFVDFSIAVEKYLLDDNKHLGEPGWPSLSRTMRHEDVVNRQWEILSLQLLKHPWSAAEHPFVENWLAENRKPLDLMVEASTKPRFYIPLVVEQESSRFMPAAQLSMLVDSGPNIARGLIARAMLRTHERDIDQAWQDLLACHRLARGIGQSPTLVESIVALAIDGMACQADVALVHYARLDALRIAQMLRDLEQLPPLPNLAEKIDEGERYMYLDTVRLLATRPNAELLFDGADRDVLANMLSSSVDWEVVLTNGNEWYDRLVAAFNRPSAEQGLAEWLAIEEELGLDSRTSRAPSWKDSFAFSLIGGSRYRGERVSAMLASYLLPSCGYYMDEAGRADDVLSLTRIAFALEAHRGDHGAYPRQLADVVPEYLSQLPRDTLGHCDFVYQPSEDGYLLYGVGANKKDDGGVESEDLVVRWPARGGASRP